MSVFISKKKGNYFSFPFFSILIVFLVTSCTNSDTTNSVNLLYNTEYKLVSQEEEVPTTDYYFEEFTTIKDSLTLDDVALYKIVKHPTYTTYIGLSTDEKTPDNVDYAKELTIGSLKTKVQSYTSNSGKLFYAIYTSLDRDFESFSSDQIKNRFKSE